MPYLLHLLVWIFQGAPGAACQGVAVSLHVEAFHTILHGLVGQELARDGGILLGYTRVSDGDVVIVLERR